MGTPTGFLDDPPAAILVLYFVGKQDDSPEQLLRGTSLFAGSGRVQWRRELIPWCWTEIRHFNVFFWRKSCLESNY